MTTATTSLADWLLERIADDEVVARSAVKTRGAERWQWVSTEDDIVPNLAAGPECATEDVNLSLRSVAELRVSSLGSQPLPDFAIWTVDDMSKGVALHIARHDPARVLANCAARRAIVERADPDHGFGVFVLRHLAAPYASHPDFDPAWAVS